MGELTIRRNRGVPAARYQTVDKTEKTAAAQTQRTAAAQRPVSDALQPLTGRGGPAAERAYESRQALQMGEVVLTEVEERLGRMTELAREAARDDAPDRGALQDALDQLRGEIDQIIRTAVAGDTRLFLDGEMEGEASLAIFLSAAVDRASAGAGAAFPDWLTSALGAGPKTAEQLLSALGLDSTASGEELLAAITSRPLAGSPAAGYAATLYLGAVIAGAGSSAVGAQYAMAGIQELLEQVADGLTPDEALELLTGGTFSSFADFEAQFSSGTAPGMESFLTSLLLSQSGEIALADLQALSLLAWIDSMDSALLADLMSMLDGGTLPDVGAANIPAEAAEAGTTLSFGDVQVTGQDLSGVSLTAAGELVIGGTADVLVQGTGQEVQSILLIGSGQVTLQDVEVSTLAVDTGSARLFTAGENVLGQLQLTEGSSLTLDGEGLLRLGGLIADSSNTLRLTGGAVIVEGEDGQEPGALPLSVIVDGPASLFAQAAIVTDPVGEPLEPFDLLWKALLPGWSSITAITVNGQQAQTALWNGEHPDQARLWLDRRGASHGYSIHTLVIQGKDEFGQPKTRYAYLRWNSYTGTFEELSMYPNPFTVTGGRQIRDWAYEEATHTLYILSDQVTALAGGSGTDANQLPFSGRIVLADGIGPLELSLGGVVCRVSAGRAFDLGRGNDVTLVLQRGSSNRFESGAGCAGISLGNGTSLRIDSADPAGKQDDPDGSLTAAGGEGGAGIGRDSGTDGEDGRDRTSSILIRGGLITAAGAGGGAGIGGAVGAPVGDIRIQGGTVSAEAACHAAAIGAGIQGDCGDILITGSARIVRAVGGDPGADIGACRFGRCGQVRVYVADIGGAKLCTRAGIPLQAGERTATLPQFHLSSKAMELDDLLLSTKEYAVAAEAILEADRRRIKQMQAAYGVLYSRLEMGAVTQRREAAIKMGWSPLRDTGWADKLLENLQREIRQVNQAAAVHSQGDSDDLKQLLRE